MHLSGSFERFYSSIADDLASQPISGEQFAQIAERVKSLPKKTPLNHRSFSLVMEELKLAPHHQAAVFLALLVHRHGPQVRDALHAGGPAEAIQALLDSPDDKVQKVLASFFEQMQIVPEGLDPTWDLPIEQEYFAFREQQGQLQIYDRREHGVPPVLVGLDKEGAFNLTLPPTETQKARAIAINTLSTGTLGPLYDELRVFIAEQPKAELVLGRNEKPLELPFDLAKELGQVAAEKQERRNRALEQAEDDLRKALKGFAVGPVSAEAMDQLRTSFGL